MRAGQDEEGSLIRGWIEEAAARHGDDVYLADPRGKAALTYAGLLGIVRETERRLDEAGLPRGARVNVRLADPLRYAAALVALIASGRVVVPLDPGAPDSDVARVMGVARPAGMVTASAAPADRATATVNGGATPSFGITVFDRPPLTFRRRGRRDLLVHQRHHGNAQGDPAAGNATGPRGVERGGLAPA